ncbi:CIC11C00000002280 [Sungouiella intermedia]|uniref:CIC11C00000002280 n=1 Tax=Sungouiella intermedia TaxID=45354 RepID=A0A1L0DS16_9ASCO|nr:CIC11C00000002280 [[Candida] intermedia]
MSLLIPTEVDYKDAHGHPTIEEEYQAELERLANEGNKEFSWDFEVVPGFFVQSDPATNDLKFRYTQANLGRLKTWDQIQKDLALLNENANDNEVYKLIICARHGQGYHNMIVEKYSLDAWNKKWNVLGTDGELVYGPDAMLSELGLNQGRENNNVWKEEIEQHGAPIPSKFYVSPLQRSLWTCVLTWDGLRPSHINPVVTENLRETIGQNLCDKRSSKTVISERFGQYGFVFEEGFEEEDILHTPRRETALEQAVRTNRFCQALFEEDWDEKAGKVNKELAVKHSFISTTSHAGTIRSLIIVFGHRRFTISTGGMVPIVVKATRMA